MVGGEGESEGDVWWGERGRVKVMCGGERGGEEVMYLGEREGDVSGGGGRENMDLLKLSGIWHTSKSYLCVSKS